MSEPPRPVLVVSSINRDTTFIVDVLPLPGETVLSRSQFHTLGGKGVNTAVAASKAGAPAFFLGAVGDAGPVDAQLLSQLQRLGVDTSHVLSVNDVKTGQAVILLEGAPRHENSIVVHAGANLHFGADVLHDIAPSVLAASVVPLHLEISHHVVQQVAILAADAGACVVLNPSPVPRHDSPLLPTSARRPDLWRCVHVVIVNRIELVLLSALPLLSEDISALDTAGVVLATLTHAINRMRERLQMRHDVAVIVTLGSDGALLSHVDSNPESGADAGTDAEAPEGATHPAEDHGSHRSRRVEHVPAMRVDNVVDTTGGGDCLTGYVCAGLAAHMPLLAALQTAVVASGICIGRNGASSSIPDRTEVASCIEKANRPVDNH